MIETAEDRKKRLEALKAKAARFTSNPWILRHEPFRVIGDVYFVGNSYVSTFLVDTGEGLVLIDPAFSETAYQVFDGIRKLGFDPKDITDIFLSHGHFDHVAATRIFAEESGARVWLGKDDEFFFTERPDLIFGEVAPFRIDEFYNYNEPLTKGRVTFEFKLCPGHTPGTTTMVIHTQEDGKEYTAAMHGGLGLNGLTYEELEENRLPAHLQADYVNQLKAMKELKVDVVLPSHNHNYDMLARYANRTGEGNPFIDPVGWQNMMDDMLEKANSVIPDQFK